MRASFLPSRTRSSDSVRAPALIAVGFAVLLASTWWTQAPVVTAMALVALGATSATTALRRTATTTSVVTAVHLFIYLNLYFLFVGAVCHAATLAGGVTFLSGLDFGASVVPMAIMVRRSLAVIGGGGDAPAR